MTITVYGITDESTTPEAIELVEEALNKISVRKYNTKVDLSLYPENVYASQIFSKVKMSVNSYNTKLLDKAKDEEEKEFIKSSNVNYIEYEGKLVEATNLPSDLVTAPLDIFLVYTPDEDSVVLDPESEYYNPILADGGMFDVLYGERALQPLNAKIKSGTTIAATGVISGIARGSNQCALAHKFYETARTLFPDASKPYLHGEMVGVGLLLQNHYNGEVENNEQSNHADSEVFNYNYDHIISNDNSLQDLEDAAVRFLTGLEIKHLK
jgi:hypothetical protein